MNSFDVVIAGNGIAGLWLAIHLSRSYKVAVVGSSSIENTSSYLAQGGISAVSDKYKDINDSIDSHIQDTLRASSNTANLDMLKFILSRASSNIDELIQLGVAFDKKDKVYDLHLEASHSYRRIFHTKDETGKTVLSTLYKKARSLDNIFSIRASLVEILSDDAVYGARILYNNKIETLYTGALVIASGGVGGLYKYTTNPSFANGSGIGLAKQHGAKLCDMQFIQFHPTYFAGKDGFLISEAVRGEGAKLYLPNKTPFMHRYSKQEELAPRDIVSRAIFTEMQRHSIDMVYLDATVIKNFKEKFPMIHRRCLENDIDPNKELMPVRPVQHYLCGGIEVDKQSRTTLNGLYAVGEAACTGLHGANRLASNSLIEALVMSRELANHLNNISINISKKEVDEIEYTEDLFQYNKERLRQIMWEKVGIIRTRTGLQEALSLLEELKENSGTFAQAIIETAISITNSALKTKSVGTHFVLEK